GIESLRPAFVGLREAPADSVPIYRGRTRIDISPDASFLGGVCQVLAACGIDRVCELRVDACGCVVTESCQIVYHIDVGEHFRVNVSDILDKHGGTRIVAKAFDPPLAEEIAVECHYRVTGFQQLVA